MASFTWQDGTLVSKAKVEIDGTIYEVEPEEYSGTTPLSASNLNAMQDGIYEDIGNKSQLNTDSKASIVSAINEINEKTFYSTSEQIVGKWINNKPIYRIVVDFGNLPNATTKTVATNISNVGIVTKLYGIRKGNTEIAPIPLYYSGNYYETITLTYADNTITGVNVKTSSNRTNETAVVIIEYVKIN